MISEERVENALHAFMQKAEAGYTYARMQAALEADAAYQSELVDKLADALDEIGSMTLESRVWEKVQEALKLVGRS
jgi:hypothetical protein